MLKHVMLGILRKSPSHGYELRRTFDRLLAGTWPISVAQVYGLLTRLDRENLVIPERVSQQLLPDRKVYSLTDEGERELYEWMTAPVVAPIQVRDEFILKILVHTFVDPASTDNLIRAQRHEILEAMADVDRRMSFERLHPLSVLLAEAVQMRIEADLKWLTKVEQYVASAKHGPDTTLAVDSRLRRNSRSAEDTGWKVSRRNEPEAATG
jgi:PadR family transcriptional regulator AphA